VQLTSFGRLQHGSTEERLDPELDAIGVVARRANPEGAIVLVPAEEARDEHRSRRVP